MLFQKLKRLPFTFGEIKMQYGVQHKLIFFSTFLIFLSLTYDSLFHLLAVLLHGLFESLEYVLDGCIEHLFDTGTHKTQVIVFYILVLLISYGLYRFYRFLPCCYHRLKTSLAHDKAEILSYWHFLPLLKKIKYSTSLITILSCWLYFSL